MTSSPGSEHWTAQQLHRSLPPLRWRRLPLALLWWGLHLIGADEAAVHVVRW